MFLMQKYFNTSGYASNACVGCVSELTCGRENSFKHTPYYYKLKAPIRGVNIGRRVICIRNMDTS